MIVLLPLCAIPAKPKPAIADIKNAKLVTILDLGCCSENSYFPFTVPLYSSYTLSSLPDKKGFTNVVSGEWNVNKCFNVYEAELGV